MSTLFDAGDAPVELAPPDVVRALVDRFHYKAETVKRWTKQKAETVLESCRRRTRDDENRAAANAGHQDEPGARHDLNGRERVARLEAATCLEQAVATNDPDELLLTLTHAMFPLTTDELRPFAGLVASQLRLNPVNGSPLAPEATSREGA